MGAERGGPNGPTQSLSRGLPAEAGSGSRAYGLAQRLILMSFD